jgi:hypothetical protein
MFCEIYRKNGSDHVSATKPAKSGQGAAAQVFDDDKANGH